MLKVPIRARKIQGILILPIRLIFTNEIFSNEKALVFTTPVNLRKVFTSFK
jgi:hypothetical protein